MDIDSPNLMVFQGYVGVIPIRKDNTYSPIPTRRVRKNMAR
jgi:hypothetical protein